MKKIMIVLLSALMVFGLCACGSGSADEGGQKENKESIPVDLLGYYYESIAGRGVLNISNAKDLEADAEIHWASSAFESNTWKMRVTFDGRQFSYSDGTSTTSRRPSRISSRCCC